MKNPKSIGLKVIDISTKPKLEDPLIDNLLFGLLYTLLEEHKLHLKFLQDNEMCSNAKNENIVLNINTICIIIED